MQATNLSNNIIIIDRAEGSIGQQLNFYQLDPLLNLKELHSQNPNLSYIIQT